MENKDITHKYIEIVQDTDNEVMPIVRTMAWQTSDVPINVGLYYVSALSPYLFT